MYKLNLINRKGEEFEVFSSPDSLRVRRLALKQAKHRLVKLYKNNKLLPSGRYGLDSIAYDLWWKNLEEKEDNSETYKF